MEIDQDTLQQSNAGYRFEVPAPRRCTHKRLRGDETLFGNDVIGKTIPRKKRTCLGTSQMRKRSPTGTR
jgi:hypothetical protein